MLHQQDGCEELAALRHLKFGPNMHMQMEGTNLQQRATNAA